MTQLYGLAPLLNSGVIREDEKNVLLYAAFIMAGVLVYLGAGRLFSLLARRRGSGSRDDEKK